MAVDITPDNPIIIQKKAFLASTPGIQREVFFQKKIGTGLFGGEGFVMQKISGNGTLTVTAKKDNRYGLFATNYNEGGNNSNANVLAAEGYTVTRSARTDNNDGTYTWTYTVTTAE